MCNLRQHAYTDCKHEDSPCVRTPDDEHCDKCYQTGFDAVDDSSDIVRLLHDVDVRTLRSRDKDMHTRALGHLRAARPDITDDDAETLLGLALPLWCCACGAWVSTLATCETRGALHARVHVDCQGTDVMQAWAADADRVAAAARAFTKSQLSGEPALKRARGNATTAAE
jgi:hypothetical protein